MHAWYLFNEFNSNSSIELIIIVYPCIMHRISLECCIKIIIELCFWEGRERSWQEVPVFFNFYMPF